MPPEKQEKALSSQDLEAYTEKTVTDINKLRLESLNVKRDGIAFDDEEYIFGLRSAAAPIRGQNGEVFATVNFLAPSSRVSSVRMRQLAPLVQSCAFSVSRVLGYTGEEKVLEKRDSRI
jgi:DNA-binding IclR family transcriptional regulator